jgi:D-glycero-alpha-D-manno-heptose-7-phosphate kinase
MIISRTPLRMSFVGGGSDLPAFYREEMGAVLSTSIDKYMYICVNRKFDGRIRLSYSRTEEVDSPAQLEHPLAREALLLVGIEGGVEISSMSDIPSKGSGLGSSSTYTVGLLNALYAYRSAQRSKDTLAREAAQIEIEKCGEPIGKQDQYAAAFGGLNLIRFHPDDSVSVDPVICAPSVVRELEAWTLILFTGRTRSASDILARQSRELADSARRLLMRRMVELAFEMKRELEAGRLDTVGELLDENWRLKSQMSSGISDPTIDKWYATALAHGAVGGKLLGAGHGGFLMLFAPPERHDAIIAKLPSLQHIRFGFERQGTQIVYFQPEH